MRSPFAARTAIVILAALAIHYPAAAQGGAISGQKALNSIVQQLESQQVEEVEILCLPANVESDVRMTPERLESNYLYELTIRMFSATPHMALLAAALKRTTAVSASGPADLHWGLRVTMTDGTQHRLYVDAFGRLGQVDDLRVAFRGGLYKWLRSFSKVMK